MTKHKLHLIVFEIGDHVTFRVAQCYYSLIMPSKPQESQET